MIEFLFNFITKEAKGKRDWKTIKMVNDMVFGVLLALLTFNVFHFKLTSVVILVVALIITFAITTGVCNYFIKVGGKCVRR